MCDTSYSEYDLTLLLVRAFGLSYGNSLGKLRTIDGVLKGAPHAFSALINSTSALGMQFYSKYLEEHCGPSPRPNFSFDSSVAIQKQINVLESYREDGYRDAYIGTSCTNGGEFSTSQEIKVPVPGVAWASLSLGISVTIDVETPKRLMHYEAWVDFDSRHKFLNALFGDNAQDDKREVVPLKFKDLKSETAVLEAWRVCGSKLLKRILRKKRIASLSGLYKKLTASSVRGARTK